MSHRGCQRDPGRRSPCRFPQAPLSGPLTSGNEQNAAMHDLGRRARGKQARGGGRAPPAGAGRTEGGPLPASRGRLLEQALDHGLDVELLEVGVGLAAADKHDGGAAGVDHGERGAHLAGARAGSTGRAGGPVDRLEARGSESTDRGCQAVRCALVRGRQAGGGRQPRARTARLAAGGSPGEARPGPRAGTATRTPCRRWCQTW